MQQRIWTWATRSTASVVVCLLLTGCQEASSDVAELQAELADANDRALSAEAAAEEAVARLAELEKQVREREAGTDGTDAVTDDDPDVTDPPTEDGDPPPSEPTSQLTGNVDDLPGGDPGELSVVVGGVAGSSGRVPWVVRNNTSRPVTDIDVAVTVRSDGELFASGSTHAVAPYTVAPGEVAIGYSYVGFEGIPAGATYEFAAAHDPDPTSPSVDITVAELAVRDGQITGIVENDTGASLRFVSATTVCFDEGGDLTFGGDDFAERTDLPAGATSPFSTRISGVTCPHYLAGASGRAER